MLSMEVSVYKYLWYVSHLCRGEVANGLPDFTPAEKQHVAEELSDVMLYLLRIADRCDINLPEEVLKKIEKNAQKYPADKGM